MFTKKKFLTWKKRLCRLLGFWHTFFRKEIHFFPKKCIFCFQLGKKMFSSLMHIPSGKCRHCKIDKILTIVFFCIFKKFWFFETLAGCPFGTIPFVFFYKFLFFDGFSQRKTFFVSRAPISTSFRFCEVCEKFLNNSYDLSCS